MSPRSHSRALLLVCVVLLILIFAAQALETSETSPAANHNPRRSEGCAAVTDEEEEEDREECYTANPNDADSLLPRKLETAPIQTPLPIFEKRESGNIQERDLGKIKEEEKATEIKNSSAGQKTGLYRRDESSEDRKSKLILGLMIGAAVLGLVLLGLLAWAKGREAG